MADIKECIAQFQNEYYDVLKTLFISPRARSKESTFNLEYSFSYEIGVIEPQEDGSVKGALRLDVQCYPKEKGREFAIVDTLVIGVFKGTGLSRDSFKDMLELNGLTFLTQIVRSHIITLTSMTGNQPIIMPMINIHELIEAHNSEKKNTQ